MSSFPFPPPPSSNPFHASSTAAGIDGEDNKSVTTRDDVASVSSTATRETGDSKDPQHSKSPLEWGVRVASAVQIVYTVLILFLVSSDSSGKGATGWGFLASGKLLQAFALSARVVFCLIAIFGTYVEDPQLYLPSMIFSWSALMGSLLLLPINLQLSLANLIIEGFCFYAIYIAYASNLIGNNERGKGSSKFVAE